MRVLIDTNVLINREQNIPLSADLQELFRILSLLKYQVVIHPLSIQELNKDSDPKRKEVQLSKVRVYEEITLPPDPLPDKDFLKNFPPAQNSHDIIDMNLFYSLHRDAVSFFITEDQKIHSRSQKIGLGERVFGVADAKVKFERLLPKKYQLNTIPSLRRVPLYSIDLNDDFFDSLEKDYPGFKSKWWPTIVQKRDCWVHIKEDKKIGSLLILKEEAEGIEGAEGYPDIEARQRLKICTLKSVKEGYNIGELMIKLAIQEAIKLNIDEIYTHCDPNGKEKLVYLLEKFGFDFVTVRKKDNQPVYLKKIIPPSEVSSESIRKYYPSFYDGEHVRKFLVPIVPQWHSRLFTDYPSRQTTLGEHEGKMIVEGNAIKKAYLCNSTGKKIAKGDILLFYLSKGNGKKANKEITSIGVVEEVYHDLKNAEEILPLVVNRTVYTREDIETLSRSPVKVILFRLHFHFQKPVHIHAAGIGFPPLTLREIPEKEYLEIKKLSGIEQKFSIGKK